MSDIFQDSEIRVLRTPPVNLADVDRHFFEKDLEVKIPNPYTRILKNIEVSAEGVLFSAGRIIQESFSQGGNYKEWKLRTVIKAHLQNFYRERSRLERAVWVTDDWSPGYFHWLSDALPKIIIAESEIEEFGLLLPAGLQDLSFVTESLSMLDVKNVTYVPRGGTVTVDELYYPVHTYISGEFNESIMREIRRRIRSAVSPRSDASRIYVSRRKANKRRVVNETDLIGTLNRFGFAIVQTEDLSFRQQVELFSGCEYLVSIHGAGLMNMLFMPPGGQVLEFRKRDIHVPNCFFGLASGLQLRYHYQFYRATHDEDQPHSANLIVEKSQFSQHLKELIGFEVIEKS
jgi:capsular polysaccharide biosynthesis protein